MEGLIFGILRCFVQKNLKILNLSKHSSFKLFIAGEFSIDNRYMTKTCQNPMIVSAICHL